jgi:AraC-like DNA-binding protein
LAKRGAPALDLLHDRFREPLTLASVAADVDLHPVHLARAFRQYRGVAVGEYIRGLRIEFACRELMAGHRTVAEIAHASGFADHAHFCRSFRAAMARRRPGSARRRALRSRYCPRPAVEGGTIPFRRM